MTDESYIFVAKTHRLACGMKATFFFAVFNSHQNNFARIVLNKRLNVILRGLFHSAKLLFGSGGATDVNTNLPFLTVYHESFDSQYNRVLLLVINIRLL